MGTLVKVLGADHIIWGTDSIWTGSPQWQIEALRRLEIPEDMQRQHRFPPLGPADGLVKNAIFSTNGLKLFNYAPDIIAIDADRLAQQKRNYEKTGIIRSNARYGYIAAE
jgi:hypothetical protein